MFAVVMVAGSVRIARMKQISFLFLLAIPLCISACDPQPSDEQKLTSYQDKLKGYSCDALVTEKRINDKMIATFAGAQKKDMNVAGDALYNALTLGTDTIEDGRSMSENKNEERRIYHYAERNRFVTLEQQKRCPL